ncbi:Phytochrome-associated serine/threonine-protein phosphatase [Camellia lanceoleosa]|uniref:Phytochrome-associated serine/threonine-protein phosphatase n=1 Tax=Camellia lanceoleosa TaxID=1840588 RepID=A0ACC0GQX7_9ERIC|nr:Phytochrome-associated serine/threonine-protein phosphatase [Camellia lanceoleosa]
MVLHHTKNILQSYTYPQPIWSAPNYCYRCGNVASILSFNENMEREVKFFTETEENNQMRGPRTGVPYFL